MKDCIYKQFRHFFAEFLNLLSGGHWRNYGVFLEGAAGLLISHHKLSISIIRILPIFFWQ